MINLNELTHQEISYWAVFAGSILEKLFGNIKDKVKLSKIYQTAKEKFHDKRELDALDYFYNWRLTHINEDINVKQIVEQIKLEQLIENIIRKTLKESVILKEPNYDKTLKLYKNKAKESSEKLKENYVVFEYIESRSIGIKHSFDEKLPTQLFRVLMLNSEYWAKKDYGHKQGFKILYIYKPKI